MPLVVVVPDELAPSAMLVPSTVTCSLAPSLRPPTFRVRPMMVWPLSTVPALAAENTLTAAPCELPAPSVKVGITAGAGRGGAAVAGVTVTAHGERAVGGLGA